MKSLFVKLLAVAALAASAMPADVITVITPVLYGGGLDTLGYEFIPNSALSVTTLDVFDDDVPGPYVTNGLPGAATIGIWDTGGHLLTSATAVAGTTPNDGYFADVAITPLALTAGTEYIVGAYQAYDNGLVTSFNQFGSNGTVDPNITIIQDMVSESGSFSFPGTTFGLTGGAWLGGSFSYEASTPEPGAFLLAITGLTGLAVRRLRRVR